jgi:hypothetical protein
MLRFADGVRVVGSADENDEVRISQQQRLHRRANRIPHIGDAQRLRRIVVEPGATHQPRVLAQAEQYLGSNRDE